VRRVEDPKQEVKPIRNPWGGTYIPWQPTTYSYLPTGTLGLHMTNVGGLGLRTTWKDGKRQRLETCVGPFIAALGVVAQAIKDDRAERERQRLEREAEQRRWEEERERRRAEQERLERLSKEASTWRQACGLRSYAEEGLQLLALKEQLSDDEEARRAELEWLLEVADRIDPLHS
jgi:hypothetical protein